MIMPRIPAVRLVLPVLLAGCNPATTRPDLTPLPRSAQAEIDLAVPDATRALSDALRADSIPLRVVEPRDGWLESPWFDAASGRPVAGRPLGPDVVQIRGWIAPSRAGHSEIVLETAYRAAADPSLPPRELDRPVPPAHPVRARVDSVLDRLVRRFGGHRGPADTTSQRPRPASR